MKIIFNLMFLTLLLITSIAMSVDASAQQSHSISGVVTDETSNEPIIGANVVVPGTSIGTATDPVESFNFQYRQVNQPYRFLIWDTKHKRYPSVLSLLWLSNLQSQIKVWMK